MFSKFCVYPQKIPNASMCVHAQTRNMGSNIVCSKVFPFQIFIKAVFLVPKPENVEIKTLPGMGFDHVTQ